MDISQSVMHDQCNATHLLPKEHHHFLLASTYLTVGQEKNYIFEYTVLMHLSVVK